MKKFSIISILILPLFFAFSCASDEDDDDTEKNNTVSEYSDTDRTDTSSTSDDQDKTDTGNSGNSADSGETDSSDSGSNPDTGSSDTAADNTDSTSDSDNHLSDNDTDDADSVGNSTDDPADSATDNDIEPTPDNDGQDTDLPECDTPSCTDSENSLIWSGKTTATYNWNDSKKYCENQGNGWRLPTIDELRTLIQNCSETAAEGACKVKAGCLKESCYETNFCLSKNCPTRNDGSYSRLGDSEYLWSSSEMEGNANRAWYINFKFAAIGSSDKSRSDLAYTRCVKNQ